MKDDRYFMELNALDKIDDVLEIFKEYSPCVFLKTDEGYDWMEEDHCVYGAEAALRPGTVRK